MKSVKKTFILALELELFIFKTREWSTCEGYGHYAYKCLSIKCSKYGEFEHYGNQCPSKSQHIDNVQIDDIDNSRIVEDVHIPFKVTSDVDVLVRTSTPTLETHVYEENISDVQGALVEFSTLILDDIDVSEDD